MVGNYYYALGTLAVSYVSEDEAVRLLALYHRQGDPATPSYIEARFAARSIHKCAQNLQAQGARLAWKHYTADAQRGRRLKKDADDIIEDLRHIARALNIEL